MSPLPASINDMSEREISLAEEHFTRLGFSPMEARAIALYPLGQFLDHFPLGAANDYLWDNWATHLVGIPHLGDYERGQFEKHYLLARFIRTSGRSFSDEENALPLEVVLGSIATIARVPSAEAHESSPPAAHVQTNTANAPTPYRPGIRYFTDARLEYRLVDAEHTVYEYNERSQGTGRASLVGPGFEAGGVADGFVTLESDGSPRGSSVSYAVLDEHIKQDKLLIGSRAATVLSKRDYVFYRAMLTQLRGLDRVKVLGGERSLELIASGRRYYVGLADETSVVDQAGGELFSFVDVVHSGTPYTHVELKVDTERKRLYLYDRVRKSRLIDIPVRQLTDITSGKRVELVVERPAFTHTSAARAVPHKPTPFAPTTERDYSQKQREKPIPAREQRVSELRRELGQMLAQTGAFGDEQPRRKREAKSAFPPPRADTTSGKASHSASGGVAPAPQAARRAPNTEEARTDKNPATLAAVSATPVASSRPMARLAHAQKLAAPQTAERADGQEHHTPLSDEKLGNLVRVAEHTQDGGALEKVYESPHGRGRLLLRYAPSGDIIDVHTEGFEFIYPVNELVAQWEDVVEKTRSQKGRFTDDDKDTDLTTAKREIIAAAHERSLLHKLIRYLPVDSPEHQSVQGEMASRERAITERFGRVLAEKAETATGKSVKKKKKG